MVASTTRNILLQRSCRLCNVSPLEDVTSFKGNEQYVFQRMTVSAGGIVRVPQRGRGSGLRSFNPPLVPSLNEVWIDKLWFTLKGRWVGDAAAFQRYREYLTEIDPEITWMRVPESNTDCLELVTRANTGLTLAEYKISIYRDRRISAKFKTNPSLTLAHLLHTFPDPESFAAQIAGLPATDFFSEHRYHVRKAFGGSANWIENVPLLRASLGDDPFSAFMPVFIAKIFELLATHIAPGIDWHFALTADGTEFVHSGDGLEVRLFTEQFQINEIETYIERYHSRAVALVRQAAERSLVRVPQIEVSAHPTRMSFEFDADQLSMVLPLPNEAKLAIYAKWNNRIRIELRRRRRSRSTSRAGENGPVDRSMAGAIMRERQRFLQSCDWPRVGALIHEGGSPALGDFLAFQRTLSEVATKHGQPFWELCEALVVRGGIDRLDDDNDARNAMIDELVQCRILEHVSVRKRKARQAPYRLSLTATLADICRVVVRAFV